MFREPPFLGHNLIWHIQRSSEIQHLFKLITASSITLQVPWLPFKCTNLEFDYSNETKGKNQPFFFFNVLPQNVYSMQSSVVFARFLNFCDATASSVFRVFSLLRLRTVTWEKFMLHMANIHQNLSGETKFNFL